MNRHFTFWILALLMVGSTLNLSAQGTVFSYQGELNDSGAPANGTYDLRFALYDSVSNGTRVSGWETNSAVAVSNGLFTATLNFGSIFQGTNYWLDIGVRPAGGKSFTTLYPRQPVLPVPYAIFANTASNVLGTVSAGQLTGTVPSAQISGAYPNTVNFTSGGNTFAGSFSGDGATLTNLNGSQITSGTVADARLTTNVALLDQDQTFAGNNQFTGANNFSNKTNYFSGTFFGNGLVGWTNLTVAAVQAIRDHGYMLTASQLSTVTLPASTSLLPGDIVRVSGAGSGGWEVKENSGQTVMGNLARYQNNHPVLIHSGDYNDVAASADGTRIYAVGGSSGYGPNGVVVSTDSGKNWVATGGNISGSFYSVACSANGQIVYALSTAGGTIIESTNSGASWFNSSSSSSTKTHISCTADGSKVFVDNTACSGDGTYRGRINNSQIQLSINSGSSWTTITGPSGTPTCLGVSSDCNRLVVGTSAGSLYVSSNRGKSWTLVTNVGQQWSGVWMSPEGTKFAGTVSGLNSDSGFYNYAVSIFPNTSSTSSSIAGSQGSAVELQYVGNSKFMPISSTGTIWAN